MPVEAYGFAYHSPLILWQLLPPKKYFPVLLANDSPSQIKDDVKAHQEKYDSKRMPVILAGSLPILQGFIKAFPKMQCKVLLFDCPSFLLPFFGPQLKWLDCDHQAGGAWQIAKVKPEEFSRLLEHLHPLSDSGRKFFSDMRRFLPTDKINEVELFAKNIPKYYRDLLAKMPEEHNKSPLKTSKDAKKSKESLTNLIKVSLSTVEDSDCKQQLVGLVLDYQLDRTGKRDYLTRLTSIIGEDALLKKEFLSIRKWIDSKCGESLLDAYLDFIVNKDIRSINTIVSTYKKVSEEDILLLVAYFKEEEALQQYKDRIGSFQQLLGDKLAPKEYPDPPDLGSVFNF